MSPEKQPTPVYASWVTVTNALDALSHGVPDKIDRSLFPGLNWAVQSQLLSGFRFLKLIDDDGNSSPQLVKLAEDTESRKERWSEVLREAYKDVFTMDLAKASPLQVEQAIQKYGLTGDTVEKAVRFFLNAAEFAGIHLSPHLKKKRKPGPQKKRRIRSPRVEEASMAETESATVAASQANNGTGKTISLCSGGTLKISVSVDIFSLTQEDRSFVFDLIDRLQAYERTSGQKAKETNAGTSVSSGQKGES